MKIKQREELMKKTTFFTFVVTALVLLTACSGNKILQISSAWARPGIQGNTSAAYFLINNQTDLDDKLISATSSISQATEIHLSSMTDGTMSMQQQESVSIPSKSTVEFKPQGLHIMFINLKDDLNVGDTFELTLDFENSGEKTIIVKVQESNK